MWSLPSTSRCTTVLYCSALLTRYSEMRSFVPDGPGCRLFRFEIRPCAGLRDHIDGTLCGKETRHHEEVPTICSTTCSS